MRVLFLLVWYRLSAMELMQFLSPGVIPFLSPEDNLVKKCHCHRSRPLCMLVCFKWITDLSFCMFVYYSSVMNRPLCMLVCFKWITDLSFCICVYYSSVMNRPLCMLVYYQSQTFVCLWIIQSRTLLSLSIIVYKVFIQVTSKHSLITSTWASPNLKYYICICYAPNWILNAF